MLAVVLLLGRARGMEGGSTAQQREREREREAAQTDTLNFLEGFHKDLERLRKTHLESFIQNLEILKMHLESFRKIRKTLRKT